MSNLSYNEVEMSIVKLYGIRQHIIVPNCYINWGTKADHECDLIIIKRSGYATEIEIKMSRADFMRDFKKKHGHIDERLQALYYAMPREVYEQCIDVIPDYAGVYTVRRYEDKVFASCVKGATIKPSRKLTESEQLKIARLGVMRVWNLKEKYSTVKR